MSLYNGISGIGAMLAGFGFSSLRMQFPAETPAFVQIIYLSITASAVGLELCAILNASTCAVFGPGKFLRSKGGPEDAEKVLSVLEDKIEVTLGYFMTGLYCIVLSSALKAFVQYSFMNACIVACGLVAMTYVLIQAGRRIFKSMYVQKGHALSGKMQQIFDPTNI